MRVIILALIVSAGAACARLPYTASVVHDDPRVRITLQREVEPAGYAHPLQVTPRDVAALLRGFSVREQQRLPLRWFAEEQPPKPLFRADEIAVLAGPLTEGLQKAGPDDRVHFEVIAPGINPNARKDVIAGWMAARNGHLTFTAEYVHTQVPTRKADLYDYNFPTPPPLPQDYVLYFEPGRFWTRDARGNYGVDYREFLKSASATP